MNALAAAALRKILVLAVIVCFSPWARGNQYEFTVQGQVTQAAEPFFSVGEPFTVKYIADSYDLDTTTTRGAYDATNAIATFPKTTYSVYSPAYSFVEVARPSPFTEMDYVAYDTWALPGDGLDELTIYITFHAGTITADSLPLALPLEVAVSAQLFINSFLVGDIRSYSGEPVPEPSLLFVSAFFSLS